jgi:glycosyltransferase involved in cell wall biosynthesis
VFLDRRIAAVVPAYKEELQIEGVVRTMPDYVDHIVVVDDASPAPDRTRQIVAELAKSDPRIVVIEREVNGGVGTAIEDGYRMAVELGAEIICAMAGDGQMDPAELPRLITPIVEGRADYVKGNRYNLQSDWSVIPRVRLVGSVILSFLTRFATGYWTVGDSQNGYAAASRGLVEALLRRGLYPRYGVPNDVLLTCAINGARVLDVPMDPVYGVGEQSKLRPSRVAFPIALILMRGFWIRMYYRHFLLETTPVPIAYVFGLLSLVSGSLWSAVLFVRSLQVTITTPEVVASTLLFMGGAIVLLLAIVLDVLFSSRTVVASKDEYLQSP